MGVKVYKKNGEKLYFILDKKQINKLKKDIIKTNYDGSVILKNGDRIEFFSN